jgi:uncharacterized protein with FMN-binding domain
MQPQKNSVLGTIIKIFSGVLVLGLVGFVFSQIGNKTPVVEAPVLDKPVVDKEAPLTEETGEKTPTVTNPVTNTNERKYKDGTYSATGNYISPAFREELGITLTIESDTVVAATFEGKASNSTSIKYQKNFKNGFDQYVIGKNIDSMKLQVVNGSSLTPKGFIDALKKIKKEAQT